ncbi:hypothetical protein L5F43_03820 [Aliarcobacter butzleri]|uniref:Uncharacterized protein n=1 Tax=Aliarcobacter butzleri TaxID=28197 RepID=A0AAW7PUK5_9BACT|nr:hypothetical protein [Aliarcobacter butzleri]MCG3684459.1 hypothetical protein [Aliarcobacter butzleri]MCG3705609.1 hypothetical protein [Aliarcobacter butzleri]MCT7555586.1 hypothetical protein [Aliarcobacter butzleri]MCT7633335.1 hypothetical protein [Aliarcobacter butzleri]MDN5069666.1 hypothetical protein [Aliarcobacter butzleri]
MNCSNFTLGKIANDFRYQFTNILSDRATTNNWSSTSSVSTNKEQNAFYFSQAINFDTDIVIECVYRDIQNTLQSMRDLGYEFDVKTVKKAYSIEVTNIRFK